ncbi:MAG: hypothetical protein Q7T86_00510 [Hyphomicrobiaceae bacterium]|nr:hypothetical protein [Hyphomicrobiaceae bacterium]
MSFRSRIATIATACTLFLAIPAAAIACACCASTGQRFVETGKASDYDADQLNRIMFDGKAELLTGEAEPGDIRGLTATETEYVLDVTRQAAGWTFTFKTGGAIAGTLSFSPEKLAKFEVDTRLTEPPAGGMVTLYKEWKQTAAVTGTGMFKLPEGSSLSLILQGSGNSCTSAEDFKTWSLVVQGNGFSFLFFSKLAQSK